MFVLLGLIWPLAPSAIVGGTELRVLMLWPRQASAFSNSQAQTLLVIKGNVTFGGEIIISVNRKPERHT